MLERKYSKADEAIPHRVGRRKYWCDVPHPLQVKHQSKMGRRKMTAEAIREGLNEYAN